MDFWMRAWQFEFEWRCVARSARSYCSRRERLMRWDETKRAKCKKPGPSRVSRSGAQMAGAGVVALVRWPRSLLPRLARTGDGQAPGGHDGMTAGGKNQGTFPSWALTLQCILGAASVLLGRWAVPCVAVTSFDAPELSCTGGRQRSGTGMVRAYCLAVPVDQGNGPFRTHLQRPWRCHGVIA